MIRISLIHQIVFKHKNLNRNFSSKTFRNFKIPFVNATSSASDPVNLLESHCCFLFNKKNLVFKLKLAATGSLVCWNLIGSLKVIGFLGVHSSGVEYSMS